MIDGLRWHNFDRSTQLGLNWNIKATMITVNMLITIWNL